ncbi:hypothetical protein Plhal703r1_c22g0094921 [Plasmopara halstedii]
MERLLRRVGAGRKLNYDRTQPSSGRLHIARGITTSDLRNCGLRQGHVTLDHDELCTCLSTMDIHTTGICRSANGPTNSFHDDMLINLRDRESSQPPSETLHASRIADVG